MLIDWYLLLSVRQWNVDCAMMRYINVRDHAYSTTSSGQPLQPLDPAFLDFACLIG